MNVETVTLDLLTDELKRREDQIEKRKALYWSRPETERARSRARYAGARKRMLELRRRRYLRDGRDARRRYVERHPDRVRTSTHRYYWANRDRMLSSSASYRAQNAERLRGYRQVRYAERTRADQDRINAEARSRYADRMSSPSARAAHAARVRRWRAWDKRRRQPIVVCSLAGWFL